MVKQLLRLVLVINVGLETYRYIHNYTVLILRKSLFLEKVKKKNSIVRVPGTGGTYLVDTPFSFLVTQHSLLLKQCLLRHCSGVIGSPILLLILLTPRERKGFTPGSSSKRLVLQNRNEFHIFRSQQQNIDA